MIVSISYDKGIEQNSTYEEVIQRCCNEVARVYGLHEEDEYSVLLCNNGKIQELNREYRGKDMPTDVLSFALNEGDMSYTEEEGQLLGDIVISLERAAEQAKEYQHDFIRELAYLTVHSCLHILGYDHMTEDDKKEMRTEEEFVLGNLGYVREDMPYNE